MSDAPPQLVSVEPGYRNVLRVRIAAGTAVLLVPSLVLGGALIDQGLLAAIPALTIAILGIAAVVAIPHRRYLRLRYRLSERVLQVVRGWLFHTDTVVPLVRVQHIDVVRGPLEKMFGTATLVVHTAGTHNSIVTLPGLSPEKAAEIRDAIRQHVRTDFA
ncbi:MAG TPA: PH domain-containing protein [Sphingomicrobium sp.]|nr:PH domain-containing protein [Sphingomicrobium sp.]